METLRHLMRRRWAATWVLIALALAVKLVVPAGFMPSVTASGPGLVLCSGTAPMTIAKSGMAGHHGDHDQPQRRDGPCGFAGLNAPGLGGADPFLPVVAVVAAAATILLPIASLPLRARAYLRPPLRGPPTRA